MFPATGCESEHAETGKHDGVSFRFGYGTDDRRPAHERSMRQREMLLEAIKLPNADWRTSRAQARVEGHLQDVIGSTSGAVEDKDGRQRRETGRVRKSVSQAKTARRR